MCVQVCCSCSLNHLKKVLPFTIVDNQLAFVVNRQILYASLMANKLIDDWISAQKSGVVLKLDLEKAFDMVDWDFLDSILHVKGFGFLWRTWIKGCLTSANYSIILNGRPRGKIIPTRSIRQTDPLSPFLFIIVVDCLSHLLLTTLPWALPLLTPLVSHLFRLTIYSLSMIPCFSLLLRDMLYKTYLIWFLFFNVLLALKLILPRVSSLEFMSLILRWTSG